MPVIVNLEGSEEDFAKLLILHKIIDQQRTRNPYEPVKVSAKPVTRDIALVLSERQELFPSVNVEAESIRSR